MILSNIFYEKPNEDKKIIVKNKKFKKYLNSKFLVENKILKILLLKFYFEKFITKNEIF